MGEERGAGLSVVYFVVDCGVIGIPLSLPSATISPLCPSLSPRDNI